MDRGPSVRTVTETSDQAPEGALDRFRMDGRVVVVTGTSSGLGERFTSLDGRSSPLTSEAEGLPQERQLKQE